MAPGHSFQAKEQSHDRPCEESPSTCWRKPVAGARAFGLRPPGRPDGAARGEQRRRHPGPDRQRQRCRRGADGRDEQPGRDGARSEEHTSELQSLMRISYAVFCLKKKKTRKAIKKQSNKE